MNSPTTKTLTLAIVAAVTSIAAAYFYPWPTEVARSAILGNPLFEPYDSSSVRQIRIKKFNDDRSGVDQILVRRKGEKWIIPAKRDFIAGNVNQVSLAASSLIESTVLEEVTDEQQAHLKYGVVDPDDYLNTPNRSALGTKIILQDRDQKEIASLIIGTPVKDDPNNLQHFVRIPGQPTVYVIDFNAQALQTEFTRWTDMNLFELTNPDVINSLKIENYKIDPEKLGAASPQWNYRAETNMEMTPQNRIRVDVLKVEQPQGDDQWSAADLTPAIKQQFQALGPQAVFVVFPDVQLKNKNLAKALRSPKSDVGDEIFESMKSYGFLKTGFKNETFDFDSVGGEVALETKDGVVITMYIGEIAEKSNASDLQLNYYVMFCAGVDESILPEPEKPDDPEDKAYLRLVEERKEKIKAARIRADGLNQRYAPWYYVVNERVISNLRPDLSLGSADATAAPAN